MTSSNNALFIPEGLEKVLEGLAREILRRQPKNLNKFSAVYFDKLLQARKQAEMCGVKIKLENLIQEGKFMDYNENDLLTATTEEDEVDEESSDITTLDSLIGFDDALSNAWDESELAVSSIDESMSAAAVQRLPQEEPVLVRVQTSDESDDDVIRSESSLKGGNVEVIESDVNVEDVDDVIRSETLDNDFSIDLPQRDSENLPNVIDIQRSNSQTEETLIRTDFNDNVFEDTISVNEANNVKVDSLIDEVDEIKDEKRGEIFTNEVEEEKKATNTHLEVEPAEIKNILEELSKDDMNLVEDLMIKPQELKELDVIVKEEEAASKLDENPDVTNNETIRNDVKIIAQIASGDSKHLLINDVSQPDVNLSTQKSENNEISKDPTDQMTKNNSQFDIESDKFYFDKDENEVKDDMNVDSVISGKEYVGNSEVKSDSNFRLGGLISKTFDVGDKNEDQEVEMAWLENTNRNTQLAMTNVDNGQFINIDQPNAVTASEVFNDDHLQRDVGENGISNLSKAVTTDNNTEDKILVVTDNSKTSDEIGGLSNDTIVSTSDILENASIDQLANSGINGSNIGAKPETVKNEKTNFDDDGVKSNDQEMTDSNLNTNSEYDVFQQGVVINVDKVLESLEAIEATSLDNETDTTVIINGKLYSNSTANNLDLASGTVQHDGADINSVKIDNNITLEDNMDIERLNELQEKEDENKTTTESQELRNETYEILIKSSNTETTNDSSENIQLVENAGLSNDEYKMVELVNNNSSNQTAYEIGDDSAIDNEIENITEENKVNDSIDNAQLENVEKPIKTDFVNKASDDLKPDDTVAENNNDVKMEVEVASVSQMANGTLKTKELDNELQVAAMVNDPDDSAIQIGITPASPMLEQDVNEDRDNQCPAISDITKTVFKALEDVHGSCANQSLDDEYDFNDFEADSEVDAIEGSNANVENGLNECQTVEEENESEILEDNESELQSLKIIPSNVGSSPDNKDEEINVNDAEDSFTATLNSMNDSLTNANEKQEENSDFSTNNKLNEANLNNIAQAVATAENHCSDNDKQNDLDYLETEDQPKHLQIFESADNITNSFQSNNIDYLVDNAAVLATVTDVVDRQANNIVDFEETNSLLKSDNDVQNMNIISNTNGVEFYNNVQSDGIISNGINEVTDTEALKLENKINETREAAAKNAEVDGGHRESNVNITNDEVASNDVNVNSDQLGELITETKDVTAEVANPDVETIANATNLVSESDIIHIETNVINVKVKDDELNVTNDEAIETKEIEFTGEVIALENGDNEMAEVTKMEEKSKKVNICSKVGELEMMSNEKPVTDEKCIDDVQNTNEDSLDNIESQNNDAFEAQTGKGDVIQAVVVESGSDLNNENNDGNEVGKDANDSVETKLEVIKMDAEVGIFNNGNINAIEENQDDNLKDTFIVTETNLPEVNNDKTTEIESLDQIDIIQTDNQNANIIIDAAKYVSTISESETGEVEDSNGIIDLSSMDKNLDSVEISDTKADDKKSGEIRNNATNEAVEKRDIDNSDKLENIKLENPDEDTTDGVTEINIINGNVEQQEVVALTVVNEVGDMNATEENKVDSSVIKSEDNTVEVDVKDELNEISGVEDANANVENESRNAVTTDEFEIKAGNGDKTLDEDDRFNTFDNRKGNEIEISNIECTKFVPSEENLGTKVNSVKPVAQTQIEAKSSENVSENSEKLTEDFEKLNENIGKFEQNSDLLIENTEKLPENVLKLPENTEDDPENGISDNTERLSDNTEMLTGHTEKLPINIKNLPENVEMLPVNTKMSQENTEMLQENTELLPESTETLPENIEKLTGNTETLPEDTEKLTQNTESLSEDAEHLPESKVFIENIEKLTEGAENSTKETETLLENAEKLTGSTETFAEDAEKLPESKVFIEYFEKRTENIEKMAENTTNLPENGEKLTENIEMVLENDEKFTENTETLPEVAEKLIGSTEPLPEDNENLTGSSETLPEDNERFTGTTKTLLEDAQKLIGSTEPLPEDNEKLTGSTETLPEDNEKLTGSSETLPEDAEKLTGSTETFAEDAQKLTESTETLPEDAERLTGTTKTLPEDAQKLIGSTEPLPEDNEKLTGSTETLPEDAQKLIGSTETLPEDAEKLTGNTETFAKDAQKLTESTETLPEDAERLTRTTKTLPEDAQKLIGSTEPLPEDNEKLAGSSEALPEDAQKLTGNTETFAEDVEKLPESKMLIEKFEKLIEITEKVAENTENLQENTEKLKENSENDEKFTENDEKFTENDEKFTENDEKFTENDEKFTENDEKFTENDEKFTENTETLPENAEELLEDTNALENFDKPSNGIDMPMGNSEKLPRNSEKLTENTAALSENIEKLPEDVDVLIKISEEIPEDAEALIKYSEKTQEDIYMPIESSEKLTENTDGISENSEKLPSNVEKLTENIEKLPENNIDSSKDVDTENTNVWGTRPTAVNDFETNESNKTVSDDVDMNTSNEILTKLNDHISVIKTDSIVSNALTNDTKDINILNAAENTTLVNEMETAIETKKTTMSEIEVPEKLNLTKSVLEQDYINSNTILPTKTNQNTSGIEDSDHVDSIDGEDKFKYTSFAAATNTPAEPVKLTADINESDLEKSLLAEVDNINYTKMSTDDDIVSKINENVESDLLNNDMKMPIMEKMPIVDVPKINMNLFENMEDNSSIADQTVIQTEPISINDVNNIADEETVTASSNMEEQSNNDEESISINKENENDGIKPDQTGTVPAIDNENGANDDIEVPENIFNAGHEAFSKFDINSQIIGEKLCDKCKEYFFHDAGIANESDEKLDSNDFTSFDQNYADEKSVVENVISNNEEKSKSQDLQLSHQSEAELADVDDYQNVDEKNKTMNENLPNGIDSITEDASSLVEEPSKIEEFELGNSSNSEQTEKKVGGVVEQTIKKETVVVESDGDELAERIKHLPEQSEVPEKTPTEAIEKFENEEEKSSVLMRLLSSEYDERESNHKTAVDQFTRKINEISESSLQLPVVQHGNSNEESNGHRKRSGSTISVDSLEG